MNIERVYLVYYVYTSICVVFLILGLGKFFCVRRLYDLYDNLDRKLDDNLDCTLIFGTAILIVSYVSLYFVWKGMVLLCVLVMVLCGGIFSIWVIILLLHNSYEWLKHYHHKLKNKKNM